MIVEAYKQLAVGLELVLPNGEPTKTLYDILYVPGLSYNLLSVVKMTDR